MSTPELRDDAMRVAFLDAMSEGIDKALQRRIPSAKWPIHFAQRILWKRGADPERVRDCLTKLIHTRDRDFFAMQTEAHFQAATTSVLHQLMPTDYLSADAYIEAFLPLFKAELIKGGFLLMLGSKLPLDELVEVESFKNELTRTEKILRRIWADTIEEFVRRSHQITTTAEQIGYRRLERTERHRLKRLAEEEAARKAQAEEELKRNSEEARLERDRRKAEARAKGEQARERAKQRAEEKRAQWLADHPRKKHAS